MNTYNRRQVLTGMVAGVIPVLAGCSGSVPITSGGGDPTRAKVLEMHERITGSARAFGGAAPSLGNSDSGGIGSGGTSGGGGGVGGSAGANMPFLGAFFNQPRPGGPNRSQKRHSARITRQEDGGNPVWYFDWFLGLWVLVTEEPGRSRYDLYVDEEKTNPAGHMETIWPVDWEAYPQEWSSTYEFTQGTMAGTSGTWKTNSSADGSGSSKGEHRWSDGSTQSSESLWTSMGDSSWKSRSEGPGTWWNESAGTFRHDGSGGMRHEDADGYLVVYVYNRDGSGRATFSGPEKDLPVVITWDGRGDAWITYADGRRERIDGWWGGWWGRPILYGGGGATGGGDPVSG